MIAAYLTEITFTKGGNYFAKTAAIEIGASFVLEKLERCRIAPIQG
jgi:hypothetical protein